MDTISERLRNIGIISKRIAAGLAVSAIAIQGSQSIQVQAGGGGPPSSAHEQQVLINRGQYSLLLNEYIEGKHGAVYVESKTRKFGVLWKTAKGLKKGLGEVEDKCEIFRIQQHETTVLIDVKTSDCVKT